MYTYIDGFETERLRTRFLTADDAEAWTSFYDDPVTSAYIPNRDNLRGAERARAMIAFQVNRYKEERYGLQALIEKETGTFIGMCGLLLQDINGVYEVEVGYHLLPSFWGNGFAIEAATTFKNFAFGNELAPSVVSVIHPQNINSQKVAKRNGMINTGVQINFLDMDFEIHRITLEQWLHQKNS